MIPIAETMDQVGYRTIATVGSQAFTVQVRNLNEDPWERIRTLSRLITKTTIRGSYQIGSLSSFDLSTPRDVITLWIKRSVANGLKSFWVCEYQYEMEKFIYFARIAKAEGVEVVPSIMYTASPAHTSEHWAHKTRLLMEAGEYIDRIMIEDASGIITPEGTREIVSIVQKNCEGIPLEFHSHCNSGLAPICYLEAVKAGVTTLHTAVAPLANGTSHPSIENVVKNVRRLGFKTNINDEALQAVTSHFRKVAQQEGLPTGSPLEYDLFHFEHQVPGGMMTNLTRQLREVKMEDRLEEFLDEIVLVRKEFGYPVMATPYSQIVGAQAIENVISGERYGRVTDEAIKYVLGYYGEPAAPIDREVRERIMGLPRTQEFRDWTPEGYEKTVDELRREMGPELSDDDLLLKILVPGGSVKPEGKGKKVKPSASKTARQTTNEREHVPSRAEWPADYPQEFEVDVDGDLFNVKISPVSEGVSATHKPVESGDLEEKKGLEQAPPGALFCGMAGLILSIEVEVGAQVEKGDLVAVIEAMKMRRQFNSPHAGVVKEIRFSEGEMVEPEDILMVVE
jgi:pyruvate/oxaloacetate carboxyltransferase